MSKEIKKITDDIYAKYYKRIDEVMSKASIKEAYGFVVFLSKILAYSIDKFTERLAKEGVRKK